MITTGQFTIKSPDDTTPFPEGQIGILMPPVPPGVYGAGWHRTTQATLSVLSKYLEPSMSFLDFGSGTGIIAVAAGLLYPGPDVLIRASEVNPKAIEFSQIVFDINEVEVEFFGPDDYPIVDLCIGNLGKKLLNYKDQLNATTLISIDGFGFYAVLGDDPENAEVKYAFDVYQDQDLPILQPDFPGGTYSGPVQMLGYFLGVDYKRILFGVSDGVVHFKLGQSLGSFQAEIQGMMDVQFGPGKVVIR